jgi:hypothetical protein
MIILAIAAILELGIIIFLAWWIRKIILLLGERERERIRELKRREWQQKRIETLSNAIGTLIDADESPKLGFDIGIIDKP